MNLALGGVPQILYSSRPSEAVPTSWGARGGMGGGRCDVAAWLLGLGPREGGGEGPTTCAQGLGDDESEHVNEGEDEPWGQSVARGWRGAAERTCGGRRPRGRVLAWVIAAAGAGAGSSVGAGSGSVLDSALAVTSSLSSREPDWRDALEKPQPVAPREPPPPPGFGEAPSTKRQKLTTRRPAVCHFFLARGLLSEPPWPLSADLVTRVPTPAASAVLGSSPLRAVSWCIAPPEASTHALGRLDPSTPAWLSTERAESLCSGSRPWARTRLSIIERSCSSSPLSSR